MFKKLLYIVFVFFISFSSVYSQSLEINEIMALNVSTVQDEDGDFPDWIEVHNAGSFDINLKGYGISDDSLNLHRWVFSDLIIPADEYLIIYASGKDRNVASFPLHTNFKLKSSGTAVILSDSNGIILDKVVTNGLTADVSFGRDPNNKSQWKYFTSPTPGWINSTNGFSFTAQVPQFSQSGGFYSSAVTISLSTSSPQSNIYYTIDGSEPTTSSNLYISPIQISSTTVLRAKTFGTDLLPSETITNTYIIGNNSNLPIVSISTDPKNLWDGKIGIYVIGDNGNPNPPFEGANFYQDWERPAHIEFYEPTGAQGFSIDAGIKIAGGFSRQNAQKSLAIFARDKYGIDNIPYQIFPDLSIKKFKSIVLRNSGQDWSHSMIRDAFMEDLIKDLNLGTQAYRPAVVYLNGEYWGIHNVREKLNEDFVADHYNVNAKNIDLLKLDWEPLEGDNTDYVNMLNFIINNDLSIQANYDSVKSLMDMDNFIDYMVSEIYFDNTDWPGSNIEYWKSKTPGSKWRWLIWDTDFGFGLYDTTNANNNTLEMASEPNGPDWPNPAWSTLLFRNLLLNQEFKNELINRFADYANTIFDPIPVKQKIDLFVAGIQQEMPNHLAKWGTETMQDWMAEINVMKNFADRRLNNVRSHYMQKFGLSGTADVTLTVNDNFAGRIKINSYKSNQYPWTGVYFKDVPIKLNADPYPGYHFVGWEGITGDSDIVYITLSGNLTVKAIFESDTDILSNDIVINEINYNSDKNFNMEDWVELTNRSQIPVDLSGWTLKDSDDLHSFVIPNGTVLKPGEFLVLSQDTTALKTFFPNLKNLIGNISFGLSGNGESVRIFNSSMSLIDSVKYNDKYPWPLEANGKGYTLALKDPSLSNIAPLNWKASLHGTPGEDNNIVTGIDDNKNENIPAEFSLEQNYPNPFNPSTTIRYSVGQTIHTSIKVYNVLGEEVAVLVDEVKPAGTYQISFNAANVNNSGRSLASGVYFYKINAGNFSQTKKFILMK